MKQTYQDSYVLTNVPNATDSEVYIDMGIYENLSIHVEKTGGTDTFAFTVEGSVEGETTIAADADYIDVTQYGFTSVVGATASSYTSDTIVHMNNGAGFKFVKIKIATADGGDDADFNVFVKKWTQ